VRRFTWHLNNQGTAQKTSYGAVYEGKDAKSRFQEIDG
jgi:hypothetical protein